MGGIFLINIAETTDAEEIKAVLCHPTIWGRIGGEELSCDEFTPPSSAQYIAGYVDSEIIGLMIYNRDNERLKCHFQVLPEYRSKYAVEFARMALDFGEAKNASIYADIPDCYPEVIRFAKSFGFKVVGKEIAGKSRNGELHDVIILRRDL